MVFGGKSKGPAATWAPGANSFLIQAEAWSDESGVKTFKFTSSVLEKATLDPEAGLWAWATTSVSRVLLGVCRARAHTHAHTHTILWPLLLSQVCVSLLLGLCCGLRSPSTEQLK